ncbi:MAG: tetratricopeptide repeat protein [Proteobacteria bacterium]|nr:tetratricopeptide repeat protein [Pseudomonadota bacterium]
MPTLLDDALARHRAGQLDEAAEAYRRLLYAAPDRADVLHLLGNVEYQRNDAAVAIRLIERAIALEPRIAVYRISLGNVYRRGGDLTSAAARYREALELSPDSLLAAASLAGALHGLGDVAGAADAWRAALRIDPRHAEAWTGLGDLALELGQPRDAARCYRQVAIIDPESAPAWLKLGVASVRQGDAPAGLAAFERALALNPAFAAAHYNIGVVSAERLEFEAAEAALRRALAIAPDYVDAHVNLSAVLQKTGRASEARRHREAAYRRVCLFVRRSPVARRSVLILFDAGTGNINLSHLFSPVHNTVIDWFIEYAPAGQTLPPHDLVFNGMGDPDMTGPAAAPAERYVAECGKPVLNLPSRVARTARDQLPALLDGIEGLCVPKVRRVEPGDPWPTDLACPLLLRPIATHGGSGLQRAADAEELARIGSDRAGTVFVSEFHDFRSADGCWRKYRVIFVGGRPYPYHLAISPHWLVHYATADMPAHPWKLDEERRFLEAPEQVLGEQGMRALEAVGARLDLAYAGIDFSLLPDGRILVFEANPVMLVHPEDPAGVLAHKNACIARILDAFEALLEQTVAAGR